MIGASGLTLPLPATSWRTVSGPRDIEGLVLLAVAIEAETVPNVLLAAEDAAIPVIAVVDDLRLWALKDLLLRFSCIRNLITLDQLQDFDLAAAAVDAEQVRQPGSGFLIGSTWALPGDLQEYEDRRYLSLNSPSMSTFLGGFRAALGQMRRARPALPWDPADDRHPHAVDDKNRLKGAGPFNLASLVEHAREDQARETFAGPADLGEWTSLPPPLLILGDSGTGKSLLAQLIHDVLTDPDTPDGRRGQLIEVAVAGMDDKNFDYELFGATSGVWNDVAYRVGEATQAAYGTLFLDELGDMPEIAQTRLLRFFNDLRIKIPGTTQSFFSYMQIVAATNREVDHLVALGKFRNDLFARFRVRVTLPPLRVRGRNEKKRLIDFVAQHPLVNPITESHGHGDRSRVVSHIAPEALELLLRHEYRDGNFRELEHVVHSGLWRARGANRGTLQVDDIEIAPARHRADSQSRVVRVTALPTAATVVEVDGLDELLRLADLKDEVVLQCDGAFALAAGGVVYVPHQPDPSGSSEE